MSLNASSEDRRRTGEQTEGRDAGTRSPPGDTLSPRLRAWLVRAVLVVVAAVGTIAAVRLIGSIDWAAVGHALGLLAWWQIPTLVALLLVRQTLNSLPLSLYIAGVSPYHAVLNDQVAFTIGTVAPTPSDLALRSAMFTSWGVPVAAGLAGALLHKLTFWIVRFAVPVAGLALLAGRGDPIEVRLIDAASVALAVAILVVLLLVMHSDALARAVGLRGGAIARRFRKVDPEEWAASCVRFRGDVAARFHGAFPRAVAAMVGLLVVDVSMLTLILRFVGVSSADASVSTVVAAYAIAYPLSLFPFAGLGLLDAAIVASLTAVEGHGIEASAVAALIVWRVFTVGGPILLGAAALGTWYRTNGARAGLWNLIRGRGDLAH